ncbi:hypothetical protein SAMN02745191_1113 [Anaerorhabdus furcosa]|uniref:Uncharacterized protein n=1 Tax=Anaerorhabdus furcosa TaxID=118967 RepID=A0A1T4LYZ7_9FIRM|nr:hypothetical protein SAMN02745191_1113 [Anaerorhabdus furcosa]
MEKECIEKILENHLLILSTISNNLTSSSELALIAVVTDAIKVTSITLLFVEKI